MRSAIFLFAEVPEKPIFDDRARPSNLLFDERPDECHDRKYHSNDGRFVADVMREEARNRESRFSQTQCQRKYEHPCDAKQDRLVDRAWEASFSKRHRIFPQPRRGIIAHEHQRDARGGTRDRREKQERGFELIGSQSDEWLPSRWPVLRGMRTDGRRRQGCAAGASRRSRSNRRPRPHLRYNPRGRCCRRHRVQDHVAW